MSFVPFIPPPVGSPRAFELGRRLADAIEAYRKQYPDLSRHEIRMAMREAMRQQGGPNPRLALVLIPALAALVAGMVATLNRGRHVTWDQGPMVIVITVVVAIIGLVAILSRR